MPATPDAFDAPQLAALDEAADDLHVGPVAMVHPDHHDAVALLRGTDDPLRRGGVHRERLLDQDVEIGRERGEDVGLVEVIGRADDDRVERLEPEQVLDVVERVLDPEPVGEGAGLGKVGVADGLDLDRLQLLEHRQVRHLGDGPATDDPDTESLAGGRLAVMPRSSS